MTWSVSEAKAHLSEVLVRAKRGAQVIESRGEAVAVVLSKSEFDRLQACAATPRATAVSDWLDVTEALKGEGPLDFEVARREVGHSRPVPFSER